MSQVQVDPQQPTRLACSADSYDYLRQALAAIQPGGDPQCRILAIRGYIELGLCGPARELLDGLAQATIEGPALGAIQAALVGRGTGRLSWTTLAGRFRRNLDALCRRDQRFAALAEAWATARDRFELYRASDGNYQVSSRDAQGRRCWLGGLADHKAWADRQPLEHDQRHLTPNPYLLEGIGHGHYFRRVYDETLDTFLGYSCALFVVEPDPVALAIALNLHDWQRIFADQRVMIFVGEDCLDRLAETFEDDVDLPLPSQCVQLPRWSPGLAEPAIDVVARVAEQRHREGDDALTRLEAQYAGRDARFWARRFSEALDGTGPPLRIFSAVSIHTTFLQYSMRDAHRAFEQHGCQTRLLIEHSDHHTISDTTYRRVIEEFDPDLFFLIDHLRGGHDRKLPANLPMFTWDQDQLPQAINTQSCQAMGPLDVLAGLSKRHVVRFLGVPEEKCLHAHVPTSLEVFCPRRLGAEELAAYRCDVSYVSNASQTPEQFHDEQRDALPPDEGRTLLDGFYELIRQEARRKPHLTGRRGTELINRLAEESGLSLTDEFRNWLLSWYAWRLLDRIFRHQALAWVADWAARGNRVFHLYGHGWEEHASLHPFARGFAQNGHELRCIYQASAINLQLFPGGFIHQRAIDGLAAGGFFLTRWRLSFEDLSAGRILERCDTLGIRDTAGLLASTDAQLRAALADHCDWSGDGFNPDDPHVLADLRMQSEGLNAVEVFPRFGEIVFDDAEGFARLADRFVEDTELRAAIAGGMHQTILKHFTYESEMRRFLRFHADYLQAQAQRGAGYEHRTDQRRPG